MMATESFGDASDGDSRFLLAHSADDIINFMKDDKKAPDGSVFVVTDAASRSTIEHDLLHLKIGSLEFRDVSEEIFKWRLNDLVVIPPSFNEVVGRVYMLNHEAILYMCVFAAAGIRGSQVKEMQFCEALLVLTGFYGEGGGGDISTTMLAGVFEPERLHLIPACINTYAVAISLAEGLPVFFETRSVLSSSLLSKSKENSPEKKVIPPQAQRTIDNKMLCWGCGVESSKELKRCSRCITDEIPVPARFCSTECQKVNWKQEHKLFHKKYSLTSTGVAFGICQLSSAQADANIKMACWGCGVESSKELSKCKLCVTEKVCDPARFCSKECQKKNWKRHKQAHQRRQKTQEARDKQEKIDKPDRCVYVADPNWPLWKQHFWVGEQCMKSWDCKGAVKNFKKAIKAAPDEPSPYL